MVIPLARGSVFAIQAPIALNAEHIRVSLAKGEIDVVPADTHVRFHLVSFFRQRAAHLFLPIFLCSLSGLLGIRASKGR